MSTGSGNTTFTYDLRGDLVTAAHTIDSKVYAVDYGYDSARRLAQIVYPSGRIVTYSYDASGRLSGVAFRRSASDPLVQLASNVETRPFSGVLAAFTHANGLAESRTFDNDGRITQYGVKDGATDRLKKTLAYADDINLTGITDVLDATKNETFGYTASNRVDETTGPWGDEDFTYDGVGNRISRIAISGGTTTTDVTTLDAGANQPENITTNGTTSRTFTHNDAGYLKTDTKGGVTTTYTYYHSGRLSHVNVGGSGRGPYRYNAFARLVSRQVTAGVPASTIHMVYDEAGNLIAEADSTTGLVMREYAWLDGRPLAAWKDVDTGSPIRYHVHVDHLDRPVMMTNTSKTIVWRAVYKPFGEVHSITGSAALDYRFPGQWFMLETGLHYNWHRWYDASLGRYTQPDLLGLLDGPNRYAYAAGNPLAFVDFMGLSSTLGSCLAKCAGNYYGINDLSDGLYNLFRGVNAVGATPLYKPWLGLHVARGASRFTNLVSYAGFLFDRGRHIGRQILGTNRIWGLAGRANLAAFAAFARGTLEILRPAFITV